MCEHIDLVKTGSRDHMLSITPGGVAALLFLVGMCESKEMDLF